MPNTVNVPFLISDREYLYDLQEVSRPPEVLLATPFGYLDIPDEGCFCDGPVSPRIAIVDFSEDGSLRHGAIFVPRGGGKTVSTYAIDKALLAPEVAEEDPSSLENTEFIQLNTFATAYRTLLFFEKVLGRRISWGFDGEQLLIVPRAGEMRNAFYERESRSLQFFEFDAKSPDHQDPAKRRRILTSLSHDIITHEMAHAALDGIAPDLYNATTPYSLAFHEAIADLTAIMLTLMNETIVFSIHAISSSSLDIYEILGQLAEEFGQDLRRDEGAGFLRSADNDRTLDPECLSHDPTGGSNYVDRCDPHACSQILTGAVYRVFCRHAESLKKDPERRIAIAAGHIANLLIPALDYLPPGEIGFRDFARAVDAASGTSRSGPKLARWLREELVRRGVASTTSELEAPEVPRQKLTTGPLTKLSTEDKVAREFALQHREILGIPSGMAFEVLTRQNSTPKTAGRGQQPKQLIFRVRWEVEEEHDVGPGYVSRWRFPVGTTLVLDCRTRQVRSLLHTEQGDDAREARGEMLRRWVNEGTMVSATQATGPTGQRSSAMITAEKAGRAMRVSGAARMLHITGYESA